VRFAIGDKTYDAAAIENLSLKMLLDLERQSESMGRRLSVAEIRRSTAEMEALATDAEREAHPFAAWMLAVVLWASRVLAGEQVTFADAIDFPMSQLRFLPEPQDRRPPVNPTKPRAVGKGSARGGKPRPPGTSKSSQKVSVVA
jgi:hypothetical protein